MPAKKKSKTLKLGRQFRNLTFVRESVDVENRTVELSFSSEEPVERWFGMEILGHAPGECDLSRLNNSGAFLMDHNTRDQRGAIESAVIDQKKGRAIIRLSNSVRGEELWQDLKDGIRPHISVGYNILEIIHVKRDANGVDWYRATKWQPYEISSVSVPADTSVGLGRSDDNNDTTDFNIELRELGMDPEDDVLEQEQEQTRVQKPAGKPRQKAPAVAVDEAAVRKLETERCQEIMAMGSQFGMGREAQEAIANSDSVDKFRQLVLDSVRDKKVKPTGTEMNLGLDDKDVRRYSLINAVRASITGNWKSAGFEREVSVALADKMGKDARGFYVNYEILAQLGRAAPQSTGAGMGGELVATDLWSSQFIDLLRPNSIAAGLGVRFATGLVGNVDIPKMTSGASFYWIDEDEDGTESNVGLGIVKMSPKTIAGAVPITRRLMQQSTPDIDLLVRDELLRGIGLGIDKAVFLGTGLNNQPLGIKNQTGVHAIPIPAGGWDWKTIVAFETAVAESNALEANMAYVMRPTLRGILKTTEKAAGTAKFLWDDNQVNGYAGVVSTQFEPDAMLHGDFSQALVGMWGALDLTVDKSTKAASGGTVLRVFQDADVAIRHSAAFGYGKKV
ncbi:phage major capsid protein [Shewanella sp. SW36]|uniref:phage major capsid protein n=1 Tax=unclassified Shewanella TaxID=196818 RepID=UPI0021D8B7EB|nr:MULTISPECIES: phage major capsid protein [unclassified Shewanella]MCU7974881.1 phage major capsid protein [Shewanella sp. SW36]MCU7990270.1 phage major capsid protein [Shewanella sp. SW1]MCU8052728.1 phage major capsid protein [Shewanella sp. SM43]